MPRSNTTAFPRAARSRSTPPSRWSNQRDLALAYSPGVAYPCLDIQADPTLAYDYTAAATWWA